MGKGRGLESHGWGAIGASEQVHYGATWVSFFPTDKSAMTARATAPDVGQRLRRSSAGQINEVEGDMADDALMDLVDAALSDSSEEEQAADVGTAIVPEKKV
eukprot:COSAG02_NODE_1994_length_10160_cov_84.117483_9_plen_102_part_00